MWGRKKKRIAELEAIISAKLADFDPGVYQRGMGQIIADRSNADAKAQFEEMRRVHNDWLASRFGRARRFEE